MSSIQMPVPVVFWGQRPPSHDITCISSSDEKKGFATGSRSGQICLWDISKDRSTEKLKVRPRCLLFGTSSAIISLCFVKNWSDDRDHIASLDQDGTVSLWDGKDGACLKYAKVPGKHRGIKCLLRVRYQECLIACYGCYSSILILHPYTLETLCTLKTGHNPNWIEQICFLGNVDRKDALLGFTVNGVSKLWLLPVRADMRDVSEVFEETSKKLGTTKPLAVGSWFKGSAAAVLVVFSDCWQIYDASAGKMKLILLQPCPEGREWAGGDYLSERTVVVWTAEDLKAYVYTLTPRCVPGMIETFEEVLEVSVNLAAPGCTLHYTLGGAATQCQATFMDRHWFVQGDSKGRVYLWDMSYLQKHPPSATSDPVPPAATNSITQSWLSPAAPCGLTDTVYPSDTIPPVVTCTLYVASYGRLVCGQQDGCIVVMSAVQAATVALLRPQKFSRGWPQHCFLSEHLGKVTCLLHPFDYSAAYDTTHLLSGGADFTVRLWNLYSGTLVHTFAVHGGEVQDIVCCPPGINPRLQTCVCSIAKDYSVAILSTSERRCLLVAACHSAPVTTIRWRLEDDFLLVGCMDGKLFVWQIETGTLDRCVHGEDAQLILNNSPAFQPKLAWPDYPLQILGFGVGDGDSMIQVMLFDPPNLISRLNNLESMVEAPPQKEVSDAFRTYHNARRHLSVQNPSPRRGSQGTIIAPLPVKPEYVPTPSSREQERAREVLGQAVASRAKPEVQDTPQQYINITRLVVSCLHAWGLDQDLDKSCETVLGLVRPNRPISFGLLGQGERISLVLPGWGVKQQQSQQADQKDQLKSAVNLSAGGSVQNSPVPTRAMKEGDPHKVDATEQVAITVVKSADSVVQSSDSIVVQVANSTHKSANSTAKPSDKDLTDAANSSSMPDGPRDAKGSSENLRSGGLSPAPSRRQNSSMDQQYHVRWQLSSSLTTQHLLTVVSITNTLMNKTVGAHALSVTARKPMSGSGSISSWSDDSGEEEECELVSDNSIRAAWSQLAALHCVMLPERMEGKFRPPHLPVLASHFLDPCPAIREASQALLQSELRRIKAEGRKTLVSTWASKLQPQSSSVLTLKRQVKAAEEGVAPAPEPEVAVSGLIHQQTTALIILGMIGAEFGSPGHHTKSRDTEPMDPVVARQTAKVLQSVILEKPSNRASLSSILRCSAVELMGRGFQLWEKYIDVAEVLMGLLDLAIQDIPPSGQGDEAPIRKTVLSTQTQFAAEIARRALNLMVTLSPVTTILTLAKEVSLYLGSQHVTHYPHSSLPPPQGGANPLPSTAGIVTPASSLLPMAAGEMMEIMKTAVERSTQHIGVQLLEVVDIVIFCINHYVDSEQLKRKSLLDIFPPFAKLPSLSYTHKTRRLAAGGRSGQVCIYDLKHKKALSFVAHHHPVTTLQFSEDGKQLATFSYGDSTICVWQMSSNLIGQLQNPKCSNSWPAAAARSSGAASSATVANIQWTSHKNIALFIHGAEFKFSL